MEVDTTGLIELLFKLFTVVVVVLVTGMAVEGG